jgi:hypothetical protein
VPANASLDGSHKVCKHEKCRTRDGRGICFAGMTRRDYGQTQTGPAITQRRLRQS